MLCNFSTSRVGTLWPEETWAKRTGIYWGFVLREVLDHRLKLHNKGVVIIGNAKILE